MTAAPAPFPEPVYVTRPLLPPLEEYSARLRAVWQAQWLTNNGAQHQALTRALAGMLGTPHLSLFANGTLALLAACRAFGLEGEAITTPFTFPATTHALHWAGLTPVFADIDASTLTLDPAAVEAAITPRTSAIVAVHVYGIACDVEALGALAARRGLKLIYDAAHAFGTMHKGRPLASFGDASMLSFHATKLFHTAEGGALIVGDAVTQANVDLLRNFGIASESDVVLPGINAKMSELSAALGLSVLPHLADERDHRARVAAVYDRELASLAGIVPVRPSPASTDSLQYYVIRVDSAAAACTRDELYARLKGFNVYTRRYFWPLCSDSQPYRALPSATSAHLPIASRAASEVLCLPLYGTLTTEDALRICAMIRHCLENPGGDNRPVSRG
jgi:dTDP-4-amino-4,6-dideoxygalactose transaminase